MAVVRLTQTFVDKVPLSTSGTTWYHDKDLRGFALAVGLTTRTFYASADVRGRFLRRKLGRTDVLTAPQARNMAREVLADLRRGIDTRKAATETLEQALDTYLQRRRLKASTAQQYRDAFSTYLKAWQNRDVTSITRAECDRRHRDIGRRAPYSANLVMRVLRAVLADAIKRGVITDNACLSVSWYPEQRRTTRIDDLRAWASAVEALPSPVRRAYYWTVLFTGHRKMEIATLRRDDVDLDAGTMLIKNPKRGRPYVVPIARQAVAVLRAYLPTVEQVSPGTPWLFPSPSARSVLPPFAWIRPRGGFGAGAGPGRRGRTSGASGA